MTPTANQGYAHLAIGLVLTPTSQVLALVPVMQAVKGRLRTKMVAKPTIFFRMPTVRPLRHILKGLPLSPHAGGKHVWKREPI